MFIPGYATDDYGRLIPPGLTKLVYEQNHVMGEGRTVAIDATGDDRFIMGAPSTNPRKEWLRVGLGTGYTVAHTTGGAGAYAVASAATVDSTARLDTAQIPMNQYAGIMFEVLGVQLDNSAVENLNASMFFGISNVDAETNAGAFVVQRNTDTHARFLLRGVSGDKQPFGYTTRTQWESGKKRNLGVLLLPRDKSIVFFEDDPAQPTATLTDAGMLSGLVRGWFALQTKEAAAKTFRYAGARLTLWRD